MKYVLSFVLGTIFGALAGAVIALLFAPSSGEELRGNIKAGADANYAKLQDQWQKGMQGMQAQMDKMSSDLQAMTSRSKATDKPA
jgi:gas vesicle protein